MFRVQIIPLLPGLPPPRWDLPGFELRAARDEEDALEQLLADPCDAIVVVAGESLEGVRSLCARLESQLEPDMVPLLLALDGARHRVDEPTEPLEVDGLLDLRWTDSVIAQAMVVGISRVRAGRGVAAIQQQVLGAVRREVLLLRDLSIRDGMTGLYNFRFFREVLAREHRRCQRYGRPYAVVCFDLDHLREINNRHGHEMGTRALSRVGLTLATTARSTDFTFRIGGDEFASLLLECTREFAGQYAERVCAAVRQCVISEGEVKVPISVSAGVAAYPEDGDSLEAVLRSADALLYRAKSLGRDRVIQPAPAAAGGGER